MTDCGVSPAVGTRRLWCWLVLTAALGLTACGGSSAPAASAGKPTGGQAAATEAGGASSASTSLGAVDACTLLTPADFAAATDKIHPGEPASAYTLKTEKATTDVSGATDQHSACTYHYSGHPGDSGEVTLDVMTASEYHSLKTFETGKPISGLGDEAAVYGDRPAFLLGDKGAEIANSQSSIAFGTALLRELATHF
jgi:hypothetical protein